MILKLNHNNFISDIHLQELLTKKNGLVLQIIIL